MFNKDAFLYKGEYDFLCKECKKEFVSTLKTDNNKGVFIYCPFCYEKQPFEKNFFEKLHEIYSGEIIRHKRIGIKGIEIYEMDFYLPEFNLGIELNGLFWHSEINKDKSYHKNKQLFFYKNGIEVIHFWEDEIKNNIDLVMDFIKRKINLIKNKIYARQTIFKPITNIEYRSFLKENHFQGYSYADHKYGLFYNDLLVSIMSFGKPRGFMHQTEYELVRYAIKKDYIVIGAFDKLLNNGKNLLKINSIVSFCDPLKFSGKVYENANFNLMSWSSPGFWWSNNIERFYRFKFPGNSGYKKNLNKIYDAGMKKYQITFKK